MSSQERFVVIVLASINFTHIMDAMIMMPLGDIFMDLYGINPSQFSYLVSIYALAAFFSSLVATFLLDRFDRRNALIFVYTGFSIGTLLCGIANSYIFLLSVRLITGLFGGVIGALALSIVSDLFTYERRGAAIGVLTAGFSAAAALGVPVGLFLADQFSWNAPFLFIGSLGLLITIVIVTRFPRIKGHLDGDVVTQPLKILRAIFTDSNQVSALFLGMVLVLGHFLIIPFIAPYMTRNVGFDQSEITLIYFLGGLLTVFTAPLIGRITDRFTPYPTFLVLMLISFIPVVWITNMNLTPIPVALIATSLFFIFGSGRMIAPQTMITAAVGPTSRGSFMSVKSALQQLSVALASLISGSMIVFGSSNELLHYEDVGYLSIGICVIAIFIGKRLKVAKGN